MISLKQYLVLIIAATIVSSLVTGLTSGLTKNKNMIQTLCSIFLLLSLVVPLQKGQNFDLKFNFETIENDAAFAVEQGEELASVSIKQLIKENAEAYIYDKATAMGADIKATVTVSSDDPPMPVAVKLEGSISPYAKSKLISIITNDLGISEDQQIWS